MFHEFLSQNHTAIVSLIHQKAKTIAKKQSSSYILDKALPIFFNQIIDVLKRDAESSQEIHLLVPLDSASQYGRELLRLGYTISQVVHLYGIVCEAVTETVEKKNFIVGGAEFRRFNICFDDSIAAAVTEYEKAKTENLTRQGGEKQGYLIHELRNMVTSAHLSLQMIKKGVVGVSGSTGGVLERSLNRMRVLIDRSLDEIRLVGQSPSKKTVFRLIDVVGDVEAVTLNEAESKRITVHIDVDPAVEVRTNQEDLFSALSNLVHNAVKFTKHDGNIWLRSSQNKTHEIIEVEDECGGLSEGKIEELFHPFVQASENKSGIGLGLTIARRAIQMHGGDIIIKDLPNQGCIFSILLPRVLPLDLKRKTS